MSMIRSSTLLRAALAADAIVSAGSALLMTGAAGLLASWLYLPEALLFEAGLLLLPYVAFVGWLASRTAAAPRAVSAVIGLNVLWAAACVGLLASDAVAPNALGVGFVVVQVAAVLLFAQLQWLGLRRSAPACAA